MAQTILSGKVTDSLQQPLPYTNVIAKPLDSLKKIQFSITDEKGMYLLELDKIPYAITVTHMGYTSYNFNVHPSKYTVRDIELKEQSEVLEEVVVELPVLVKQDTIVYAVDHFIKDDERKLKDVLKKLPGVEVFKDGSVTVQGKKITTMLVENKKFFGGGTKLAVDNIPADAVHQVEVIENYSEIPFLKNLTDSDETAMNIKLKENKKDFVFGDIEAGKGNQEFYNLHSNLFYYSPETAINAIGNVNNTAEKVFTYKQYLDFQTGLNRVFVRGSTTFDLPTEDFLQFMERNDVVQSDRKFGALNITKEVNDKLNISGYGIFSNTKEGALSQSINQYNTFTENKEVSSEIENMFALGDFTATYLPNITTQIYFKTKFKKSNNQYQNGISSLVDTTDNIFNTSENGKETFFNQVIEWHKKKSTEHTFSAAANYTFTERIPRSSWNTKDDILQGIIPIVDDSVYRIRQYKYLRNNNADFYFKHYWVLNKNNHIYSSLGNTYNQHYFFTDDSQLLSNGNSNNFKEANFGNDLHFNLNDLFLGVNYKFRTGIFTFDQGAFFHYYHWKLKQQEGLKQNRTALLPNFSVNAEFSRLKKLEFKYELKTAFKDVSNYADRYYLFSYNSVYIGNGTLKNELYHDLNLRYSKYSGYKGFRLYLTANYRKKTKGVVEAIDYSGINQSLSPIMLRNPERDWNLFGSVKKKIKKINYGVNVKYHNANYLQQVNGVIDENKRNNFTYKISAKTLLDSIPTIELGYEQNIGSYNLGGQKSKFITNQPYVNIDYDFWGGFIASFDYEFYKYKNKRLNQRNNYEIANASLYYRKDTSAWSFKVEANNLFNVRFKNQNSFSSYVISDTKTYILPRIVMFSIGYNL
ncbi:carboxypeptidase-like regulatory domain-containing protein [Zhouia amylolytica]|uniref:carboxypeptidase-like regulatory domain-containing protein n=1 Tax=Zhouia amylolytica TaxID=376730 RepID=UPI0020CC5560|nr:carboxypeptidase-like regulatory domain-containing protein [Zhouia amylolytica]MCQ0110353.1 carboxypeptidase regulatory-like domain-containing protein [Zhouia amylolytica]